MKSRALPNRRCNTFFALWFCICRHWKWIQMCLPLNYMAYWVTCSRDRRQCVLYLAFRCCFGTQVSVGRLAYPGPEQRPLLVTGNWEEWTQVHSFMSKAGYGSNANIVTSEYRAFIQQLRCLVKFKLNKINQPLISPSQGSVMQLLLLRYLEIWYYMWLQ